MPTTQSQLLDALRGQIAAIDERSPGYRKAVADTLADIITLERQHQSRSIAIRQEVKQKCLALGDFLASYLAKQPEETADPGASE